jgi:hypothetical protein
MEQGKFDSGIVMRVRDEYKVICLPDTVGVNQSLLNAPLYVLHEKAARKINSLEISWRGKTSNNESCKRTFRFIRAATDPLPTVVHAKYLDILLAMFSQNWNQEGILHFRYGDILRIAGKPINSRAREAIQQTILRYHLSIAEWENCWQHRVDRISFNIIYKSSILNSDGTFKKHNPGRSQKIDDWHTVKFHEAIVEALKNENKRILLTDLFQKLEHDTFCVYRYYYGYPDFFIDAQGAKKPNLIWRNIESLQQVFRWTGQQNRFRPWINERFRELLALGLIDEPIWKKGAVAIHCKNLQEILPQQPKANVALISEYDHPDNIVNVDEDLFFRDMETRIDRPLPAVRTNAAKARKVKKADLAQMTSEAILTEYYARKKNGLIGTEKEMAIDLLLQNNLTKTAIELIKSQILTVN